MIFNEHFRLAGKHAFLSPSKYHWLRYDDEKFERVWRNREAAALGVRKHAFAHEAIALGENLPKNKKALNRYVNDGIGLRMTPEVALYYSDNAFGHADTLKFDTGKRELRIHDYKSGVVPGAENQLDIYSGLFCLEYDYSPHDIMIRCALYQGLEPFEFEPDPDWIAEVMEMIVRRSAQIDQWEKEAL